LLLSRSLLTLHEYWDDLLQAENDLLRATLAENGLAYGADAAGQGRALVPRGGGAGVGGGGNCQGPRPPRTVTPPEFCVSDPQKGVERAAGGGVGAGSQASGGAARKRRSGKHSETSRLL